MFNELPDDLVRHILDFLPTRDRLRVALVCKAWRKSYKDQWLSISLAPTSHDMLQEQAGWLQLLRHAHGLTNLEILPGVHSTRGHLLSNNPTGKLFSDGTTHKQT